MSKPDELKYYEKDGFLYFVNSKGKTIGFIKKLTDEERKVLEEKERERYYYIVPQHIGIINPHLGIMNPKNCMLLKPNMLKNE